MGTAVKIGIVTTIGVILVIGGGLLIYFFPTIIEGQVAETLNLESKKGLPYDNWVNLSLPLSMKFYFFDVQNADDVVNHGAKPKLLEKGPYTFSETRKKINVTWNEKDNTVSYYQTRTYQFVRSESVNDLEDHVTIPNVPAIAIAAMGRNESKTNQKLLGLSMSSLFKKNTALYMTKTIRELIFDGYFDSFIEKAQKIAKKEILPNHMFAFMYGLNGAHDGQYTVHTGKDDVNKYSVIKEWKGPKHLFSDVDNWSRYDKVPMWDESSHCSDINGTDGQQFPPFVKKDSKLRIFISEMCRSAYVVYQKEVKHYDITAYRFAPDVNMMADPTVNPDNYCFCDNPDHCMFSGAISVSKCQRDAPVFLTFPHFYKADPLLLRSVDGLKPDPEKHIIFLDVEPLTGTPIKARRCSQVNIDMQPMFPLYKDTEHINMPRLYHPVLWLSEEGSLNEDVANTFKAMALTPIKLGTGVTYGILALGGVLVLVAAFLCIKRRKSMQDDLKLDVINVEMKENLYMQVNTTTVVSNDEKKRY